MVNSPEAHSGSISEQIRRAMNDLSPAELRVARKLLAGYPAPGLGSAAELASEASVSSATVIRFTQKLGFRGFPDFHSALREELSGRRAGPIDLLDRTTVDSSGAGMLGALTAALAESVAGISETIPPAEFDAATRLLSDSTRKIYLVGGRASHPLAELLAIYLSRLRPDVSLISRDTSRRLGTIVEASRRSVLVAFDFRRYEISTVEICKLMAKRGAKIVIVTDVLMSPATSVANIVLPVQVDVPSPFDTFITGVALVECLALAVMRELGDDAINRMREWDAIADQGLVKE
ncbi:MAG TPA: MurR/RpiR family transcriptional regulator [Acidimicrobiales bacterium]